MSAFSSTAFNTAAFSQTAFDFGTAPPPVVITIDTHDGFDGGKEHSKKREAKDRLHNQVEEAFRRAFEKPASPAPVQADAAYFDPLQGFIFPAYRELPKVDDDSDDEEWLLLS